MSEQVYTLLRERILTCALKPGSRLSDKDLGIELGVSRTPIREAFNRLAHDGLVENLFYRGYRVAPVSAKEFSDLCEIRRMIEPQVAGLAAARSEPADITTLLSLSKLEYVPGDPASYSNYLKSNSAFHLAIASCARNSQAEAIVTAVLDRHQRPCYLGLDVGIDAEESTVEHVEVIMAIRDRDSERASKLMSRHIASGEQRILAALKAAGY